MSSFLTISSLIGLFMAIFGFYLSVRLDLPLGPTDVAFGCAVIFLVYMIQLIVRKGRGATALVAGLFILGVGCGVQKAHAPLDMQALGQNPIWLASVRNSTGSELRLPGGNPLRSLGEMAGKISPDYRPTVMDLLRASMKRALEQRKVSVAFPEERDVRLLSLPFEARSAATHARTANLSGWLLLSDIRRWSADARAPLRTWVEMRLVRIDNGAVDWERQIQKTIPVVGSGRLDEVSADAVTEILREAFGS